MVCLGRGAMALDLGENTCRSVFCRRLFHSFKQVVDEVVVDI